MWGEARAPGALVSSHTVPAQGSCRKPKVATDWRWGGGAGSDPCIPAVTGRRRGQGPVPSAVPKDDCGPQATLIVLEEGSIKSLEQVARRLRCCPLTTVVATLRLSLTDTKSDSRTRRA